MLTQIRSCASGARALAAFAFRGKAPAADPARAREIARDFLGICVASAEPPETDDAVIGMLRELGLKRVRLDFGYDSRGAYTERFLRRLLAERFSVLLHLVQPRAEAQAMRRPEARERWRRFLIYIFENYSGQVEAFEAGSTVNRRRWSGYTLDTFHAAWAIAWEEAARRNLKLAGPNVTDFEPFYNAAILDRMRREGRAPAAHTDNLFVERATEPEAYDHKILGRRMARWLGFDFTRKAGLLADISAWADIPETWSTHASWSLRRIARFLPDTERKQSDYVARYCLLGAASGRLQRLYWGPLVGQREGLVDDGTDEFPETPHVTFYGRLPGSPAGYRARPAFNAFRTVSRLLAESPYCRTLATSPALTILEFWGRNRIVHAVWTGNGMAADPADCYEGEAIASAFCNSIMDEAPMPVPKLFTETPVLLSWSTTASVRLREPPAALQSLRMAALPGAAFGVFETGAWSGLGLCEVNGRETGLPGALPGLLDSAGPGSSILRDSRNRVWKATAPWAPGEQVVCKWFRPPSLARRLLSRGKPVKAIRSWNGAMELLRRGIATPRPIACAWSKAQPSGECYYVCESFEGGDSARSAFNAFRGGASSFMAVPAAEFYQQTARFLVTMHERGVLFRDLSAGNLLFRVSPERALEFALIDTARARFLPDRLGCADRLKDLIRICHPLDRKGRASLLGEYFALFGRRFAPWMRIPFIWYDAKHAVKNRLKRFRQRVSSRR
ncbi:MAG: hypothetical protein GX608_03335 [Lentisphaerae bacterium]|nr:hypothetical protein [Lentisphaerota bacterium]